LNGGNPLNEGFPFSGRFTRKLDKSRESAIVQLFGDSPEPGKENPMKTYVDTGDTIFQDMPYSEVCMHMRVAGHAMFIKVVAGPLGITSAQLYDLQGNIFSAPITMGEAGFYFDEAKRRFYCYGIKCEMPTPIKG